MRVCIVAQLFYKRRDFHASVIIETLCKFKASQQHACLFKLHAVLKDFIQWDSLQNIKKNAQAKLIYETLGFRKSFNMCL